MSIARLLCLKPEGDNIQIFVFCKGLKSSENTLEVIAQVFEDVSDLVFNLLRRSSTLHTLAASAKDILGIEGEV